MVTANADNQDLSNVGHRDAEREQILAAMSRFDAEQRDRYWRGWERSRGERYAIHQRGHLYPARHLLSMAVARLRNAGLTAAVAVLRALGFEVVELPSASARTRTNGSPKPRARTQAKSRAKRLTNDSLIELNLTLAPLTVPPPIFQSERQFELQVVAPHLKAWGCKNKTQVTRTVLRGKQKMSGRIDFVVHRPNSRAVLTVIEAKRSIRSLAQLYHAALQAESYARALRLRYFVVAAPEGCWIFSRARRNFEQLDAFGPEVWDGRAAPVKSRLYELVGHQLGV